MKNLHSRLGFRSFVLLAVLAASTPPLGGQQAYHGQVAVKTADGNSPNLQIRQQDEVGAVMLSLSAFPWDEVASQMNANITRTVDQVLSDVQGISAAEIQSNIVNNQFQAAISTIGSVSGGNSTAGNSTANGLSANTTGSLPNLGTLPILPGNLSADQTEYWGQAYKDLEWLAVKNRLVQVVYKAHYIPYLVNVNVDFVPYRTDAEVNVFTTIAFFAYDKAGYPLHRQPIVVPVLSTDDLQQIRLNAASQQLSDVQLSAGGVFHAITAGINAASGGNATQGFAGDQLNSLVTSGPFMRNAYFVRFGAHQQANGPALVPQSIMVPVVVLIPDEDPDPDDFDIVGRDPSDRGLQWVSYTVMRDAKTGVALAQDSRVQHTSLVDEDLRKFYDPRTLSQEIRQHSDIEGWFKDLFFKPTNAATNPDNTVLDDIRDVKVPEFLEELKTRETISWSGKKLTDYEQPSVMQRIWTMLAAAVNQPGHFNSGNLVLLSTPMMTLPPSDQAVTLADDGKTMTATIVGGNNLAAGRLRAKLRINGTMPNADSFNGTNVWAQNITVSTDGHSLQLTFPSLANFGPPKPDSKPLTMVFDQTNSTLTLYDANCDPKLADLLPNLNPEKIQDVHSIINKQDADVGKKYIYGNPIVYLPSKSLDATAKPLFRLGAPILMVDQTGKGTLSFWITSDAVASDKKKPNYLNITGADIILPASMPTGSIVALPDSTTGMMAITAAGQASFPIQNASPANDISISVLDNTGVAKPNPVTLRVQFQPAAAKSTGT